MNENLKPETPLTRRFQRQRWSHVRRRMDAMGPGTRVVFSHDDYYNAQQSAYRLTEAYYGKLQWKCRKLPSGVVVERVR